MKDSTRIIANTIASYARLCVLALVGILATPIILHILGPIDFGIFSVIAGSLAFLMFINGALTTGAQRHIAYSLGEDKQHDVIKWFTVSLIVHIVLGIVIAIIALGCSHWVLFKLLNLPAGRLATAVWIYRMVVIAMVCNIISTPFQAFMMAQESIVVLSLISILSAAATIVGALALKLLPGDSLLWYSSIYCFSQLILFLGPISYTLFRYRECRKLSREGMHWHNLWELLSFSGWNFFGALAAVIRSQGPALLLNIFIGPAANAAYGLAIQANGFSSEISWGVLRATTSPIVKRHAVGDQRGMASLSNLANKYAFLILWLAVAPVLFEIGFCLKLWLRHVPAYTASFVVLLLIALLIDQLTSGFGASLQATGRIAAYQVVVGGMNCIVVPAGYILLRTGMPANSILWAGIGGAILAGCCRLWFAKQTAKIPVTDWLRHVLLPSMICLLASSIVILLICRMIQDGPIRFGTILLANTAVVGTCLWQFGITPDHRVELIALRNQLYRRISGIVRLSES
jgi:O-antigen/teichoic acid export membrane protein